MAKRGLLIVFEGCDRSGKSTQCKKLIDFLRKDGQKAELLRFPGISHKDFFFPLKKKSFGVLKFIMESFIKTKTHSDQVWN